MTNKTMPEINFHIAESVLALINSSPNTPSAADIIHAIDVAHMNLGIPRPGSVGSRTAVGDKCHCACGGELFSIMYQCKGCGKIV